MKENNIILQGYTENKAIPLNDAIIKSKKTNSICVLNINGHHGIGFFLKVKKSIFLITGYSTYYIKKETKNIEILLQDKYYSLNLKEKDRKIKFDKEKDLIAIEIIEEDEIKKEVNILKIDLNYIDGYKYYLNKDVICFQTTNDDFSIIYGKIIKIDKINDFKFKHSLNINLLSYGTPIFLLENSRVIGLYTKSYKEDHFGTFIGELIKLFDDSKGNNEIIKLKIKDLMKFSKSLCKVYHQKNGGLAKNGFFITLGKKLNYLFTIIVGVNREELKENIKIILYNGKKYYIQLNKKERIIRFFNNTPQVAIEILDNDDFKNDIAFLSCDFNCDEDSSEYKSENIFISSSSKSYIELEFTKILNVKDKIYFKKYDPDYFKALYSPIISIKSLKVLGVLSDPSSPISYSKKIYEGLIISRIRDKILEKKQNSLSCRSVPLKTFLNVSKSICFLSHYKNNGFFIKIKKDIELYFLVIYTSLSYESKLYITIENENEYKEYCLNLIEDSRIIFNYEYALLFIQILEKDEIKNNVNFLRCETEEIKDFKELEIFSTFFSIKNNIINCVSGQTIKEDNSKKKLYYLMDMSESESGSPIILIDNLKVIGIHNRSHIFNIEEYENIYFGDKIKNILDKMFEKINNKKFEINGVKEENKNEMIKKKEDEKSYFGLDFSYLYISKCGRLDNNEDYNIYKDLNEKGNTISNKNSELKNDPDLNNNELTITYKIEDNEEIVYLFDSIFVENNKNICKIEYEGREYNLFDFYKIDKLKNNKRLIIKLKNIDKIRCMNNMFSNCKSLLSVSTVSKWNNTNNITNLSKMFFDCESLTTLPDISNWNTCNVTDMSHIFFNCKSLKSLPDISKWNTSKVTNMSSLFENCKSLKSLPDISKWNTSKVTDMSFQFGYCESLSSFPDISKWNINKVTEISYIFSSCKSLLSLPDISKWNTNNINTMIGMFYNCESLTSLPDISQWNINKVKITNKMFYNCKSLLSLPDISKWNTNNISSMEYMFYNCESLSSLPDISRWNLKYLRSYKDMFAKCDKSLNIPPNYYFLKK